MPTPAPAFPLTPARRQAFFHVNDVHAHLDEFARSGTDCKDPTRGCVGGYARILATVMELRRLHPQNLWLNAGDEFQGTLFYNYYGGAKIAETLKWLRFDAMTLGNHEWDGGDDALGSFVASLDFPVVSCNLRSQQPDLNATVRPYHIFERYGLAVIGATTPTTKSISNVGPGTNFLDPVAEVQSAIYKIRNETAVRRIVALTHLGYDADQELAQKTEGLSLIIGGHSHTLLGNMTGARGKYPTIVRDAADSEVFIVTSYRWGEYIGSINVTFDADGKALEYRGAPIHMDNTTAMDPELQAKIQEWREPLAKYADEVVGTTVNELDQARCRSADCLLGQAVADSMLEYRRNQTAADGQGAGPDFALVNGGGIRATIDAGDITRGQVLTALPFGNAVVELAYPGDELRKVLEGCVSQVNQVNQGAITSWLQVSSGVQIRYDPARTPGSRLLGVSVGGKPLNDTATYRVVTVDFLAGGGDNMLPQPAPPSSPSLNPIDAVFVSYLQSHSPLNNTLQERVLPTSCRQTRRA